jgi:hypothetical protein
MSVCDQLFIRLNRDILKAKSYQIFLLLGILALRHKVGYSIIAKFTLSVASSVLAKDERL